MNDATVRDMETELAITHDRLKRAHESLYAAQAHLTECHGAADALRRRCDQLASIIARLSTTPPGGPQP